MTDVTATLTEGALQNIALIQQPTHCALTPDLTLGIHPDHTFKPDTEPVSPFTETTPVLAELKPPTCVPKPVANCFCKVETLHD
jgi:hypothetical protein